jgi:hypothetical protein
MFTDRFSIDWAAWWASVTPEFAFLLALPFGVAAAALAGDAWRRRRRRQAPGLSPRADAAPPAATR